MRCGFPSLARLVQESLKRDPHAGDLYVFRGRRGDLIKVIWWDGQGACLFTNDLHSYYSSSIFSRVILIIRRFAFEQRPINEAVPSAALFLR
jgi:transposase